jgi:hypothetical protein
MQGDPGRDGLHPLPKNQPPHLSRSRTQHDANANLIGSLRHDVAEDAIQSHGSEDQR